MINERSLPAILLFCDHLEAQRRELAPQEWERRWLSTLDRIRTEFIRFSWFPTTAWASIARIILMAQLNPNHSAVRRSGIHRSSVRGTNVRTVVDRARVLGTLARWPEAHNPGPIASWGERDGLAFVQLQRDGATPPAQTRLKRAGALRALHVYRELLPGGGLPVDPFDGQALPKAVGYQPAGACTGPLVARDVFWPLLRGAWAYLETFAEDILGARDEWDGLRAQTPVRRASAAARPEGRG